MWNSHLKLQHLVNVSIVLFLVPIVMLYPLQSTVSCFESSQERVYALICQRTRVDSYGLATSNGKMVP